MTIIFRPSPAELERIRQRIKLANERMDPKKTPATGKIRALAAPKPAKLGKGSGKAKKTRQGLKKPGTVCEELLDYQLIEADIPVEREYRFHPTRRWRFDFVIKDQMLAIEIDGGNWAPGGGRHGSDADREKMAEAAIMGYRVIRASPAQVRSGQALEWVKRALI